MKKPAFQFWRDNILNKPDDIKRARVYDSIKGNKCEVIRGRWCSKTFKDEIFHAQDINKYVPIF